MTHSSDEQLNAGSGLFGRVMGNVYMAFVVLAIPVTIAVFVTYMVQYG